MFLPFRDRPQTWVRPRKSKLVPSASGWRAPSVLLTADANSRSTPSLCRWLRTGPPRGSNLARGLPSSASVPSLSLCLFSFCIGQRPIDRETAGRDLLQGALRLFATILIETGGCRPHKGRHRRAVILGANLLMYVIIYASDRSSSRTLATMLASNDSCGSALCRDRRRGADLSQRSRHLRGGCCRPVQSGWFAGAPTAS